MVFISFTDEEPEMLCPLVPTDGLTRATLPVSMRFKVMASKSPTPPSVTPLVMSEKLGMSLSG